MLCVGLKTQLMLEQRFAGWAADKHVAMLTEHGARRPSSWLAIVSQSSFWRVNSDLSDLKSARRPRRFLSRFDAVTVTPAPKYRNSSERAFEGNREGILGWAVKRYIVPLAIPHFFLLSTHVYARGQCVGTIIMFTKQLACSFVPRCSALLFLSVRARARLWRSGLSSTSASRPPNRTLQANWLELPEKTWDLWHFTLRQLRKEVCELPPLGVLLSILSL